MTRDRLGGFPFEAKSDGDRTIIRFYPKSQNAKNPNSVVFVLSLDKEEKSRLKKIIS